MLRRLVESSGHAPVWTLGVACLLGCVGGDASPPQVNIHDPLGLMDVVGDLRLLVFPAAARTCDVALGELSPALSDASGATFDDAVVDIRFGTDEAAMVTLDEGLYTVLVRGRGIDPVSMRPDQIVATGCAGDVQIDSGGTRDITLELKDVVGMGVCDDGVLSPDEQCEAVTGPSPCVACVTQSFVFHTATEATQERASVAWGVGQRILVSFESNASSREVRTMVRDGRGDIIMSPSALAIDQPVDFDAPVAGVQSTSAAAISAARLGVAFTDFPGGMGEILVRFFDQTRSPMGPPTAAHPMTGGQTLPDIAMTADGTALVVFADTTSASGASASLFAAGSTTPGTPAAIGTASVQTPAVAAAGTGFLVAFVSAGDIFVQRFDAAGVASAALPVAMDAGEQSDPAVAALDADRFLVTWTDPGGIRAKVFTGDTGGTTLVVGAGVAPAVGAGGERFLLAWEDAGTIRARLYDGSGQPARNRESPPTPDAFVVAMGAKPDVAAGGDASQAAGIVVFEAATDIQSRIFPLP